MNVLNLKKLAVASVVGVSAGALVGSLTLFAGQAQAANFNDNFPGSTGFAPADDTTKSLGQFQIAVNPKFWDLFNGYSGFQIITKVIDGKTYLEGHLTSPVLYDPDTVIGRSAAFIEGDATDITDGAEVGTAKTKVKDGDFTIVPNNFETQAGIREIHTEVRKLNLTGSGAAVRVGTGLGLDLSPGEVESRSPDPGTTDFPADSFFNIKAEIDIPGGGLFPGATLYNQNALLITHDGLTTFPDKVVYIHGNSSPVDVFFKEPNAGFWAEKERFGSFILAGHGINYENTSGDIALFSQTLGDQQTIPTDLQDQVPVPEPSSTVPIALVGLGALWSLRKKASINKD